MSTIHIDLLGTETRFHDTGKHRTRCIEAGSGPALFAFHGGGGHAETYARNMTRLATRNRVIAPDFIWHGMSSKPAFQSGNWLKQFTGQILDLMDHLGIEKASFEGESLGGWIVMDLGIHHPDRVEKLILNTAWGMNLGSDKAEDLSALRETSLNALRNPSRELIRKRLEWLMPLGGVTEELIDLRVKLWSDLATRESLTGYYERLFAPECEHFLYTLDDLARIKAPTLLLWTEKNPIAGPEAAFAMHEVIKNSSVHIVKDAAHWPQWERPEEHDRVVLDFLAK
ncbi:MAG TPA: alpha/beta hydrolase [Aromatoleum sp.]|uniref:alpha/beta fold hydrolase n=1 Tax=Aromatoleum sp. TaxID=2307007 RepID=UPI002B45C696|nr:alpha/beta hydrolase [Aromatoleum sp.]HJV25953.1 alpha/beta hydrolase [Aromatoleum sp.]